MRLYSGVRALLGSVTAIALVATGMLGATGGASAWSLPFCRDVAILGLRGMATDTWDHDGFGAQSWGVSQVVQAALEKRGFSVKPRGVLYPEYYNLGQRKFPNFYREVNEGLPFLANVISNEHQSCPNEKFVIVAHSLGAGIVHVGLAPDVGPRWAPGWNPNTLTQVSAFVFLGDPMHYANTAYDRQSSDPHDSDGYGVTTLYINPWGGVPDKVPSNDSPRIASYCLPKDPVCGNFHVDPFNPLGAFNADTHGYYADSDPQRNRGVPDKAAQFVSNLLPSPIPVPTPSPPPPPPPTSFSGVAASANWTGDGRPSLLARKSDGSLWLYRGNGRGGWLTGAGEQIGQGWQIFNSIVASDSWTGDGRPSLLARKSDGTLWLYRGNGRGGWLTGAGEQIGQGWEIFA
jgi:cutinase